MLSVRLTQSLFFPLQGSGCLLKCEVAALAQTSDLIQLGFWCPLGLVSLLSRVRLFDRRACVCVNVRTHSLSREKLGAVEGKLCFFVVGNASEGSGGTTSTGAL